MLKTFFKMYLRGCLKLLTLLMSLIVPYTAQAYGIDCNKPSLPTATAGVVTTYTFTCTNTSPATFYYFDIKIKELDHLTPATTSLTVTWPDPNNIAPGHVGVVTGTVQLPETGNYSFDFDKAHGGETFSGIFCKNGSYPGDCFNVNAQAVAYITLGDNTVKVCQVNSSNGEFVNCKDSGATGLNEPNGIATATIGKNTYIYMINNGTTAYQDVVTQCQIMDADGTVGSCEHLQVGTSTIPTSNWRGITFYPNSHNPSYAYVSDGETNGYIWKCAINPNDGTFIGTCEETQYFSEGAYFTTVQAFNNETYLYVPNGSAGEASENVQQCTIDSNGNLSPCSNSGDSSAIFDGPAAIAFANNYAYISNWSGSAIDRCNVNTGSLYLCVTTFDTSGYNPFDIKIKALNNSAYAYIALVGLGNNSNYVLKCTVDSNGNLVNCYNLFSTNIPAPSGIAFQGI